MIFGVVNDRINTTSLSVVVDPNMPSLAWLAKIDIKKLIVNAEVGERVEVGSEGFVEGVWTGDFAELDFDEAPHLFGTGLRMRGEQVILVSSSAITDRVYYVLEDKEGVVVASNSLTVLLQKYEARLDPGTTHWSHSSAIGAGLTAQPVRLSDINGDGYWHVFVSGKIAIGKTGVGSFEPLDHARMFTDYAGYRSAVDREIKALFRNIGDARRKYGVSCYTTASAGYDSSCVSALVSEYSIEGCFCRHRSNSLTSLLRRNDDDGSKIAEKLGFTPLALGEAAALEETFFRASSCYPAELVFASALRTVKASSVLFTGYFGDTAWGQKPVEYPDDVRWPAPSGVSLSEPRLLAGVFHVPLPFLFSRSLKSLREISCSPEMAPWRLGTNYDRPIPRRILESAGIPREAFGQHKHAIVNTRLLPYTSGARSAFLHWANQHNVISRTKLIAHDYLNRYTYPARAVISRVLKGESARPVSFLRDVDTASYMMCWSSQAMVEYLTSEGGSWPYT